jgi:subtilisin-like proprotein convertase family protein
LAIDPKPVLGFGTSYILTLTPEANQNRLTTGTQGGVDITIRADDGKGNVVFAGGGNDPTPKVTVIEVNDPPVIGTKKDDTYNPIPDQSVTAGQVININFDVADLETAADDLVVTATSSNTSIIPITDNVTFPDSTGPTRSVRIPVPENAPVSTVTITLTVKDTAEGASGAKSVSKSFTVDIRKSTAVNYASAGGAVTINDNSTASQYPSSIIVPPVIGGIGRIEVQLTDLSHTFPGDLDILLVSPKGTSVLLMSDAGRGGGLDKVDILFQDGGTAMPDNGQIVSGIYRPTNYDAGDGIDVLPAPAPAGPFGPDKDGGALANFIGEDPEGSWSLFIFDDTSADGGSLVGWSLLIETGPEISGLLSNVTLDEDQSFTTGFSVQDETDLKDIKAVSDNQNVIPDAGLTASFDDKGNATLTITPGVNAFGTAKVTVTVRDRDLH